VREQAGPALASSEANLLASFSAVEQGVPVVEVAAIFQKDPPIIMAHPEAGLKAFGDLAGPAEQQAAMETCRSRHP
jgi:hypothetical protein